MTNESSIKVINKNKHENFAETMIEISGSEAYKFATQEEQGKIVEAVKKFCIKEK